MNGWDSSSMAFGSPLKGPTRGFPFLHCCNCLSIGQRVNTRNCMIILILIIAIFAILEIKFSPRIESSTTHNSRIWYLFYNIKSKTNGIVSRDYLKIIEIKKNE